MLAQRGGYRVGNEQRRAVIGHDVLARLPRKSPCVQILKIIDNRIKYGAIAESLRFFINTLL